MIGLYLTERHAEIFWSHRSETSEAARVSTMALLEQALNNHFQLPLD